MSKKMRLLLLAYVLINGFILVLFWIQLRTFQKEYIVLSNQCSEEIEGSHKDLGECISTLKEVKQKLDNRGCSRNVSVANEK